MSFEVTDFQADVLDQSTNIPVLVDFWAPWCGPCRVLGPVLEKLAEEANGSWNLVKINTDQHQQLSVQYGIRGIPAVKLFVDGQVADEFTGALPEYAVRQWLEKALPSENKARLEQAQAALDAGDPETAEPLLRAILQEEPTHPQAKILLAQILAFHDPDEAEALVDGADFAGPSFVHIAEAIKTVARAMRLHQHPDRLPDEPGRDTYLDALNALAQRDFETTLERFIAVIQQNRYYDEDGSRKACIALFTLLGPQHPITRKHRRLFDMALY